MNRHQLGFNAPAEYHQLFQQFTVSHEALLDLIASRLSSPFISILDAGCGTGLFTKMIAARLPASCVYGIDISPQYIEHARRTNEDKNISYLLSDFLEVGNALPAADVTHIFFKGSFHLIEANVDLDHLKNAGFYRLKQVVVIEKTERSLETYPVPKAADQRRRVFVSRRWQRDRLAIAQNKIIEVVTYGCNVSVNKSVYKNAIEKRQFSYLASVTDGDILSWKNKFQKNNEDFLRIFEENIAYIIHY